LFRNFEGLIDKDFSFIIIIILN